jgi:hypothetical protein
MEATFIYIYRRFETGGVPGPTSEDVAACPSPDGSARGRARRGEDGVREVEIPRPSCSSRAQVGCACSRGLQAFHVGLGKKPVTRNPNPEYPNPNPKYPKPEFCSGISGSNMQNPKLFRVSQSGTRNTRITRTFMCHVLMSCLIINLYIYNYV